MVPDHVADLAGAGDFYLKSRGVALTDNLAFNDDVVVAQPPRPGQYAEVVQYDALGNAVVALAALEAAIQMCAIALEAFGLLDF